MLVLVFAHNYLLGSLRPDAYLFLTIVLHGKGVH